MSEGELKNRIKAVIKNSVGCRTEDLNAIDAILNEMYDDFYSVWNKNALPGSGDQAIHNDWFLKWFRKKEG